MQPKASVARSVTDAPAPLAVVGVPLKIPAEVRVRPAGSVPLDTVQVYGEVPLAAERL